MITFSAPGSMILLGEHAVLHQEPAIACAVNRRLTITLTPRMDNQLHIHSMLGDTQASLTAYPPDTVHPFIREVLIQTQPKLTHGLTIQIDSELPHTLGLGSSAAVTVALIAALHQLTTHTFSKAIVLSEASSVIRAVQGMGSGLDAAASIYGGLLSYQIAPSTQVTPLPLIDMPCALYYSGYKKPTHQVLKTIQRPANHLPFLFQNLYQLMGDCTRTAQAAIINQDLEKLGLCMNFYHGLLDTLGVCDLTLSQLTYQLRQDSRLHGVKITGSGLGDCVLAMGYAEPIQTRQDQYIPIQIDSIGLRYES